MSNNIDNLLHEERRFPPSAEFTAQAVGQASLYADSKKDRLGFWDKQAKELLHWHKPFTQTLDESNAPFYRWFGDGELNVSANCLDVHLTNGNAELSRVGLAPFFVASIAALEVGARAMRQLAAQLERDGIDGSLRAWRTIAIA